MIRVNKNEATAARRRVYFHVVDVNDGMTPETGEEGGQPQVSVDGAAWTNTGIGVLAAIGNGRYYAELAQTLVNVDNAVIETRYKSANTAECPGDTAIVDSVIEGAARASTALSNAVWTNAKAAYLDEAVSAAKTLTAAYDAAKTAAQASTALSNATWTDTKAGYIDAAVSAIPTTPLLAASYTAPDNAGVAAIKAKTDNLPSDPADASVVAGQITDAQSAILTPLGVVDGILDGIAADYAKTGEAATAASPIAASLSAISASLPSRIDAQLAANHGNTQWGVLYTTAAPVSATLPAGTTVWTTRL